MKTVYIPKGHTVCYESLETEHLVVEGCLKTTCGVKAKTITGGGVLSAGTTSADVICLDELETGSVFCRRLLARRVQTPELFASDSAAVPPTSLIPAAAAGRPCGSSPRGTTALPTAWSWTKAAPGRRRPACTV